MIDAKFKKFVLTKLAALYPNPRSELNFSNQYQLAVSVILSAQCTDKKVNEVTPQLFARYSNFRSLSNASVAELEQIIRPINYYKTKAKNLIALGSMVTEQLGGTLPSTQGELTALPGIGRKTANVIRCEQGVTPALPVDTHVMRVSQRLGLTSAMKPEQIEKDLCEQFPPELWHDLHHWLILHGRRVCKARSPACSECPLRAKCPVGLKLVSLTSIAAHS